MAIGNSGNGYGAEHAAGLLALLALGFIVAVRRGFRGIKVAT